ncbi:MAG: CRTAC1 family protein [Mariniblastus sp.]
MREDPTKSEEFQNIKQWDDQKYEEKLMVQNVPDPTARTFHRWGFTSYSLSGKERNRLFLQSGDNFSDVTLVSGADDIADGRSFAIIDYDQDGWQDIAMMSLNVPRFKLYRNELCNYYPSNKPFRFRLVGGQTSANASAELSNRDGIGARVLVTFKSGKTTMMQKQAGEGFASQNSGTLSIGIPSGDSVVRLDVRWPSGKTSEILEPDNMEICLVKEE